MEPPEAIEMAKRMADISGYAPYSPEVVAGGYRDWFIQHYGRPGFTIEVGKGVNPLPISQLENIWERNAPLMMYAATL